MNRRELPSASFTYISRVSHVWSTGPVADLHSPSDKLRLPNVNVLDLEVHHPTRYPVTGKRRDNDPHIVARKSHVTRINQIRVGPMGELQLEAHAATIELLRRRRIRDMQQGSRALDHHSPRHGSADSSTVETLHPSTRMSWGTIQLRNGGNRHPCRQRRDI